MQSANCLKRTIARAFGAGLAGAWLSSGVLAQSASSDKAASFFRAQGLLLNQPAATNGMLITPQVRAPNLPDTVKQEKFDVLKVDGVTYTNVVLRSINANEGALHHDGGLLKIHLADLPETVRWRFCDPNRFRIIDGQAVSTNGWPGLFGEVAQVLTNGILLQLYPSKGADEVVFVACDPKAEGFSDGQQLNLLAQRTGTTQIEGRRLTAYDAGRRCAGGAGNPKAE